MARDPERRRISREAQNARRRLLRRAAHLRKQALTEANAAVKKVYRNEARNIERAVKKSAIPRGSTLKEAASTLEKLKSRERTPATVKNSNILIRNEMKRAMDSQQTVFGSGREGRARVKSFFMFYRKDWESQPFGDRYQTIMSKHPGMSIADLYEAMQTSYVETASGEKKTYEQYIADRLGIDYSNVDTGSSAWKAQILEAFESLDSAEQNEYANAYAMLMR